MELIGLERYQAIYYDLGRVAYRRAHALQDRLKPMVRDEGSPGRVLFLEHPPTVTLGWSLKGDEGRSSLRSSEAELARAGIELVQVDRGGKATYHGPGQLVCYLILHLKPLRLGVKRYVGKLESAARFSLREFGLDAELDPLYPGVWVNGSKLAAVGIRVEDRVTSHGLALNLTPDLEGFARIVPCGIPDRPVTSLSALGRPDISRDRMIAVLLSRLAEEFKLDLRRGSESIEQLMGETK